MIRPDRQKIRDIEILDLLNNGDDSEIEELADEENIGEFCHEDIQLLDGK